MKQESAPSAEFVKATTQFIHELGQLSMVDRTGWWRLGVHVENDATHTLRVAQIAYLLARMERHPDPYYAAACAIFHENEETRTLDHNRLSKRYVKIDRQAAARDQVAGLGEIGESIFKMWQETERRSTTAGVIVKDADYLETAFRAVELFQRGLTDAREWFEGLETSLITESAKTLYRALLEGDPNAWWKNVSEQSAQVSDRLKASQASRLISGPPGRDKQPVFTKKY